MDRSNRLVRCWGSCVVGLLGVAASVAAVAWWWHIGFGAATALAMAAVGERPGACDGLLSSLVRACARGRDSFCTGRGKTRIKIRLE